MHRMTLLLTVATTLLIAASAAAETPCLDQEGDALKACLKEAVDAGTTIALPTCEDAEEDDVEACQARAAAYQKALGEVTGDPCAGLADEALATCKEARDTGKKKKGLKKDEGTKMERLSGTGDEDE